MITRRKYLARSTTPIKRSPIKRSPIKRSPIKVKRTVKRFAHRRDPAYRAWIRTLPCAVYCPGQAFLGTVTHCAHVKTRGAGSNDVGNCYPACARHHWEQHTIGIKSFQAKYGVDLATMALGLAARYESEAA